MSEKILIVGAGQFGRSLALELARRGADVTVLDSDEDRLADLQDGVSRTIIGDGTDPRVLESLDLTTFTLSIDAIGEESLQASILCAALLGQLGARHVVARVVSDLHARILSSLGVGQLVHPERDMAKNLAERIMAPGVRSLLELEEGVRLAEVEVPEIWVGKTLQELGLRQRIGVTIVALRRPGSGSGSLQPSPPPDVPIGRGEVVVAIGSSENMDRFLKEVR
ncbi:MAG: hypothetical protein CMJ83_04345 [Planctomycetes bacterium]|nr:hypothetical protein [Planctomycetota bacterium]